MQEFTKLLALTALLAFTASNSLADQTNLVQNLSFQLSGAKQGSTSTVGGYSETRLDAARVENQGVLEALAAATGRAFSTAAHLILISPLPSGVATVAVQDGTSRTDVSRFFVVEQESGSLESSVINLRTGRGLTSDYSLQRFVLADADGWPALALHFDIRGIAVTSVNTAENRSAKPETLAEVSGAGDRLQNLILLRGTVRLNGGTFEVHSNGGGGV